MGTPEVRPVGRTAGFAVASGDSHAAQHILPSSVAPGRRVSQEHVRECRLGISGDLPAVPTTGGFAAPVAHVGTGVSGSPLATRRPESYKGGHDKSVHELTQGVSATVSRTFLANRAVTHVSVSMLGSDSTAQEVRIPIDPDRPTGLPPHYQW